MGLSHYMELKIHCFVWLLCCIDKDANSKLNSLPEYSFSSQNCSYMKDMNYANSKPAIVLVGKHYIRICPNFYSLCNVMFLFHKTITSDPKECVILADRYDSLTLRIITIDKLCSHCQWRPRYSTSLFSSLCKIYNVIRFIGLLSEETCSCTKSIPAFPYFSYSFESQTDWRYYDRDSCSGIPPCVWENMHCWNVEDEELGSTKLMKSHQKYIEICVGRWRQ